MASFIKDLAKKEILVPHINNYLARADFPETFDIEIRTGKEPDDAYHPSSDCYPCECELYNKRMGLAEKQELTATSHKNFFVGHFWHGILQNIICDRLGFCEKEDVEKELRYQDHEWWARGFADIAKCDVPGKGSYLIDFKTMNSFSFQKPSVDLLVKWQLQVACYMAWDNRVDSAIIIGIQKDTPHEFKEFVFQRDDSILEEVYNKWTNVSKSIRNETPVVCSVCA
jgi:hypothetical protein